MKIRRLLLLAPAIALLVVCVILLTELLLSKATSSCPWSHRLNSDMVCLVRDSLDGALLIEHFNRDTNELQLSIHSSTGVKWIKHPRSLSGAYQDRFIENRIQFDRTHPNAIIVNGAKETVEVLRSE
jgi:hypothetical protein